MSGLLDFLQGASNAAAGTVSGPVDLISWLIRKGGGGGIIGDAPVGSSAWMAQKGLTRPTQGMAGLLGEAAGLSLPIVASAKAPQIASGLLQMQANAAAPTSALNAQRGAIVYHGSPHKFDKFDSSKIGTGEGAQAYGNGLYLTESPEVAKQYAGDLAAARASRPIGNVDLATAYQNMPSDVPQSLLAARRDFRALNDMGELSLSDRRDFLEAVRNNIVGAQSGSLYKVDLPDSAIARMLDWDKPLSQQAPSVAEAISKAFPGTYVNGQFINPSASQQTGRALLDQLQAIANKRGAPGLRQAEPALRAAGVPGIRYLDGGSRGAGAGTSNFVVFPGEEPALKILQRNGFTP